MLSRIANNLYWAGRYLERMEHTARCVPVFYFSALDGMKGVDKNFSLRQINGLAGDLSEAIDETTVLFNVAFELENLNSIKSCVTSLRENCRGSRDLISTELWESVNTLYHFINSYDHEQYLSTSMQAFMNEVMIRISVIKSRIENTLIQNQVWSILVIGQLLERSYQINRIVRLKLNDLDALNTNNIVTIETFELSNLMRALESFDMSRKYYRRTVDRASALEFLYLNPKFPRSMLFCIHKLCEHLMSLGIDKKGKTASVLLKAQQFKNELDFTDVRDLLENTDQQLRQFEGQVALLHNELVSKYFSI